MKTLTFGPRTGLRAASLRGQQKRESVQPRMRSARSQPDEKDQSSRETDRQARIESLRRQVASLEGDAGTRRVTVERLQHEIGQRLVRAPASGKLGEVAELRIGGVVREGEKLGAVLPAGTIRAVAEFSPSAMGRFKAVSERGFAEGFP